jgi:hypothetical protein
LIVVLLSFLTTAVTVSTKYPKGIRCCHAVFQFDSVARINSLINNLKSIFTIIKKPSAV